MFYTLEQVLANRKPLITIRFDASLLGAFRILVEQWLGQLPVIDETGRFKGIISQQAIRGIYYLADGKVPLFYLAVADCMEPVHTLSLQDDLLWLSIICATAASTRSLSSMMSYLSASPPARICRYPAGGANSA